MPQNKSHHFVPQFYLRNFGAGNSIALFNIGLRRHIRQASIPGQCQRSYLYGEDGKVEAALADIEGRACTSIRNIIASERAPADDSVDFFSLIMFVASQHGRTPQAGEVLNEIATKVSRAVFKMPGVVPEELHADIPKVRCSWRKAALQSLGIAAQTSHVLLDLRPLLLVNDTQYAFITSDSPVVFFNSWCRGWRGGGVTGLASTGLQIVLPLSPRHALLLFDADVYSVMSQTGALRVTSYRDVKGINALQLLSATSNLYYRENEATAAEIDGLPFNWHFDRVAAVRLNRAIADDQRSQLIHFYQQQAEVRPDLSFIRVRREMRAVPLKTRARTHRERALEAHRFFGGKGREPIPPDLGSRVWHVVDSE